MWLIKKLHHEHAHKHSFKNTYRTSQQLAMKLVVLLLLTVVAAANAKFQFTEEWELWKKVPLSLV